MKAKIREVLERAIVEGVVKGYQQAFKHTDSPREDHILSRINSAIWLEIDTYFDFEETFND